MSKEDDRQTVSMRSSHCDMKQLARKLKWIKLCKLYRNVILFSRPKRYYRNLVDRLFYLHDDERYMSRGEFMRYEYSIYVELVDNMCYIMNFTMGDVPHREIVVPRCKLTKDQWDVLQCYDSACKSIWSLRVLADPTIVDHTYYLITNQGVLPHITFVEKTKFFYIYKMCSGLGDEAITYRLPICMLNQEQQNVLDRILQSHN